MPNERVRTARSCERTSQQRKREREQVTNSSERGKGKLDWSVAFISLKILQAFHKLALASIKAAARRSTIASSDLWMPFTRRSLFALNNVVREFRWKPSNPWRRKSPTSPSWRGMICKTRWIGAVLRIWNAKSESGHSVFGCAVASL